MRRKFPPKAFTMFPKPARLPLSLALVLTFLVAACASAPYTGRRQVLIGSEAGEISSGQQAFQEMMGRYRVCQDPAVIDLVNRVGSRIAAAANRPDYHWEFVALENPQEANAFCLPGGKVGVFTGVLKYTRDEAGLATVISHEAAHALARHAGERQSQATLAQMGGLGLGLGLGGVGGMAGQAIAQGYSLGTKYGILLPYSRSQELEADKIGLILMAKAGYDPALALDFWRRMMENKENKLKPPQFLSTHPRDDRRLQAMAGFLPQAEDYYITAPLAPGPPAVLTPPPPAPGQAPPPLAPPAQAPPAAPPARPTPAPETNPDDLELKPMDNRTQPAPPCVQWVPVQKK